MDNDFVYNKDYDNSVFLIFDAIIVEQVKILTPNEFLHYCKNVIKLPDDSKIFYRFHPEQNLIIKKEITRFLKSNY
ncbi:MAG: hypothetical protein RMJ89_10650, partial [Flammeovirgaceae bacterium]|nr:hypothetical protein [Flammeovirgaceae bacterium]